MEQSHLEPLIFSIRHGETIPPAIFSANSLSKALEKSAFLSTGIKYYSQENKTKFQSYEQLLSSASEILAGFRELGLEPQAKVILQLSTPDYFLSSLWACFFGGFVPIPLGVELVSDRSKLAAVCEFDCQLIVTEKSLFKGIHDLVSGKQIAHPAIATVENLQDNSPDHNWHESDLDDLALLLFTSGSTGKPKGVMLSQRNILASIYGMATVNQISDQDITLNWMPLEHVASLVMFHLTEVYLGCDQIQVASQLILQDPLTWLDLIDRDRVTACLLYTSPSPRDRTRSRMPSSA